MKLVKLIIKQVPSKFGYLETRITHIKEIDEKGNYIQFLKHEPFLIQQIQEVYFSVLDEPPKFDAGTTEEQGGLF